MELAKSRRVKFKVSATASQLSLIVASIMKRCTLTVTGIISSLHTGRVGYGEAKAVAVRAKMEKVEASMFTAVAMTGDGVNDDDDEDVTYLVVVGQLVYIYLGLILVNGC